MTGVRQAIKMRTPVSIGYPTVDLDTLFVTSAERVFAAKGVKVRTRAPVRSIDVEGSQLKGVTLLNGEQITADAVICAVPVWRVRGLLDQVPGHEKSIVLSINSRPCLSSASICILIARSAWRIGGRSCMKGRVFWSRCGIARKCMVVPLRKTGFIPQPFQRPTILSRAPTTKLSVPK